MGQNVEDNWLGGSKSESLLAAEIDVPSEEVVIVNESMPFFPWDIRFWASSKPNLMINLPSGNAHAF